MFLCAYFASKKNWDQDQLHLPSLLVAKLKPELRNPDSIKLFPTIVNVQNDSDKNLSDVTIKRTAVLLNQDPESWRSKLWRQE